MTPETRLKRLRFRACHRGTKEADLLIGGFADRYSAGWAAAEVAWFEALLDEDDVDIMAWAIGTEPPPERWQGTIMAALHTLNYVPIAN